METTRHIGVDLHRNKFTCCMHLANGRNYLSEWKLENLPVFVKKLRPTDAVAVEVTGNTRLFYDAVAPHVARVVAVDPNQFRVISHSVKKKRIRMTPATWRYICPRDCCQRYA